MGGESGFVEELDRPIEKFSAPYLIAMDLLERLRICIAVRQLCNSHIPVAFRRTGAQCQSPVCLRLAPSIRRDGD